MRWEMKNLQRWTVGVLAGMALFCLLLPKMAYAAETVDGITITPYTAAMVVRQMCMVRSGPSKDAQKLAALAPGTVVNACGRTDDGWYQVVCQTGLGYVYGDFLTEVFVEEEMRQALAVQAEWIKQGIVPEGTQQTISESNAAEGTRQTISESNAAEGTQQTTAESGVAKGMQQTISESNAAEGMQQTTAESNTAEGERPVDGAEMLPAGESAAASNEAAPLAVVGNVIFVGDSRTGQMSNAVGGSAAWPGVAFIACYGGGVEWLSTPKAKKDIDELVTPGTVIVINYGVNDLSRHGDYIETINRYAWDWKQRGATVYFASVGPVGENEYGKRNWAVEYFNEQLNNRLSGEIGRIDLYGYLTLSGYGLEADGLHYTPDTYAVVFQFLMQSIGKMGEMG